MVGDDMPGFVTRSAPIEATVAPRVFLVDDDHRLRSQIRDLMEDEGIAVVGEAGDGAAAVAGVLKAAAAAPVVVLMDIRMPGALNGIEATRRLTASEAHARVLMFTGFREPGMERAAREAGAVGFLVKGAAAGEILGAVRRAWVGVPARR
jgi:DNA-binding NarL/FixJ family response regulator